MSHKVGNYAKKLRNSSKAKKKKREPNISGRAINKIRRTPVQDFSHQVRKYPGQAAQRRDTFSKAAQYIRRGEIDLVVEALDYLVEHSGKLATYNKKFGEPLAELARRGHAKKAIAVLNRAINSFPENIAANPSLGEAFEALLIQGYGKQVAGQVFTLCTKAPELAASNPDTGWLISEIFKNGQRETAANAFIVVATRHPKEFARSESVSKAIRAVSSHDFKVEFGNDKAKLLVRLCDKLTELRLGPENSFRRTPQR